VSSLVVSITQTQDTHTPFLSLCLRIVSHALVAAQQRRGVTGVCVCVCVCVRPSDDSLFFARSAETTVPTTMATMTTG
jgi:hypothetical protein